MLSKWWRIALLALAYVATAKLGLGLPVAHGVITPVWAPTGLSLAAMLLLGPRATVGIAVGAFAANATSGVSLLVAALLAAGNTLEAVVGWYLLRRFGFDTRLGRVRDVLALTVCGAVVSTTVSATNGVTVLLIDHTLGGGIYLSRWFLWWFGDAMGDLLVAPLILVLVLVAVVLERGRIAQRRVLESIVLGGVLVGVSAFVFLSDHWSYPYLLFPLFVWAALRFVQPGAVVALFITAGFAVAGTIEGTVPVGGATATQSVQLLQALFAVASVSLMVLAASLTERQVAEEQLRRATRELHELYEAERVAARDLREIAAMKDTLLAAVSHELRTPLTSILGIALTLQSHGEELTSATSRQLLKHLAEQSMRLDRLLTDLLDLDRIRRGLLRPDLQKVDVGALVAKTAAQVSADRHRVELDVEPCTIDVDPAKVERIVENLMTNAVKHTPADTCVTVEVRRQDRGVLIAVKDRGAGVSSEHQESIFELFNRGDQGITHAPGTGIGLSLVRQYADLHGGRAWVLNRDHGGASFNVFLPG